MRELVSPRPASGQTCECGMLDNLAHSGVAAHYVKLQERRGGVEEEGRRGSHSVMYPVVSTSRKNIS
jgi:hypothetical protein